ncbi:MAG: site-specific integrase [Tannerellaceae bacterium]|nr:site-specific integrase [Tannerellaceae bacterium]
MVSIEIHYRSSGSRKDPRGSLFVRVIARRKTVSVTLPYRLYPQEWDPVNRSVLVEDAPQERREYLREVVYSLERDRRLLFELRNAISQVDAFTSRHLVDLFKVRRFKSGFKKVVDTLSEDMRRQGRERTARAYQSSFSSLLCHTGKKDLAVEEITYELLQGFEGWLLEGDRSLNTVSFYMRNLRAMYNKAVKRGWIVERAKDLFRGVFTGVSHSQKRALTIPQMKQLSNLLEEPEVLSQEEKEALSLFLFAFHAQGISFVDLAYLKKEDIKGQVFIYSRKKTGTLLEVEINPQMSRILSFFKERTTHSPFVFPLIEPDSSSYYESYTKALRKQNARLNRIAGKVGILHKLTTHVARHSWATIAKERDIPVWLISEALGHKDVKTTYIYLNSFEKKVIHRAARKVSTAVLRSN